MVAEADDALMERFFEAGTLTQDELLDGLRKAVLSGKVAPLLCASGLAAIGTSTLLDALVGYVPSPVDRPFTATDTKSNAEVTHTPNADRPVRRLRVEDGGRPLRRPHHAVSHHDGHAQGRHAACTISRATRASGSGTSP